MLLANLHVLALEDAEHGALARLLRSLGATISRVTVGDLAESVAAADVLIDGLGTTHLERAGISRTALDAWNPRLLHVSVTPFGSSGPRAHWHGSELVASAMGGALRLTGDPDRAPVKEALDACWFHAEMVAASGLSAALYERDITGRGQHIDVSVQEVAFSRNVNGVLAWQFDRRKLHRVGGALSYGIATVRCIWALADGYCFHSLMTGRFGAPANQALSDWMNEAGIDNPLQSVNWETYNRSTLPADTRAEWERAIEAFFLTRTRDEINTEGRRRGINATVLNEPRDVLADPHLRAREFWRDDAQPRRFVRIEAGKNATPNRPIADSSRTGPLRGIRVLDFSWAIVGSITTKLLGDFGCDVIKVESRGRPCLSRIDVQVAASRPGNFDDKPWFAHLNTSKRSLALDMKKPQSREVLEPLIEWADVVVENFSPGTMAKLGLDYASLAKRNPGLIMVSGSVFGQTGPLAEQWGVDGTGAALSGRTFMTGWPDRNPVIPGAVPYGDVVVPYVMAAAVAAALHHKRTHGVGCHIDAAMYEICVQQMLASISAASQGQRPERCGNDDPRQFHQGVYATAGIDRWIAITVATHAEWSRLAQAFGFSATDSAAARHATLTALAARHEDAALVAELQAIGIAAGVVQDIEDLIERDPQLATRGALTLLDHSVLGQFGHVRTPVSFSGSSVAPYRAPRIGEHSHTIARELSGLSDARIAELDAAGVFK